MEKIVTPFEQTLSIDQLEIGEYYCNEYTNDVYRYDGNYTIVKTDGTRVNIKYLIPYTGLVHATKLDKYLAGEDGDR
jgi:hypothetical protein